MVARLCCSRAIVRLSLRRQGLGRGLPAPHLTIRTVDSARVPDCRTVPPCGAFLDCSLSRARITLWAASHTAFCFASFSRWFSWLVHALNEARTPRLIRQLSSGLVARSGTCDS